MREGGKVYIGGDRALSSGPNFSEPVPKMTKVWTKKQAGTIWAFGHSGSSTVGQIVRYLTPLPRKIMPVPPAETTRYLVTEWVPSLRTALNKRGKIAKNKEDGTDMMSGGFLIGVRGHLFIIDAGFFVTECETYAAIGEGRSSAYGALLALEMAQVNLPPMERLRIALSCAEATCPHVGKEIDTVHT
jgi:hypothetical protein